MKTNSRFHIPNLEKNPELNFRDFILFEKE